jgi:hypothetical protein
MILEFSVRHWSQTRPAIKASDVFRIAAMGLAPTTSLAKIKVAANSGDLAMVSLCALVDTTLTYSSNETHRMLLALALLIIQPYVSASADLAVAKRRHIRLVSPGNGVSACRSVY